MDNNYSTSKTVEAVSISYKELTDGTNINTFLEKAYDDNGLGLMLIRDVPGFKEQRQALLRMSWELAHMPKDYLKSLERPEINYMMGWNSGHSGYLEGADFLQSSFYANIVRDEFIDGLGNDQVNQWPDKPPGFREAYLTLSANMRETGLLLAHKIDQYLLERDPTYNEGFNQRELSKSQLIAGRLLFYEPPQNSQSQPKNWCSWHKDYSAITGLAGGMFFDKEGNQVSSYEDEAGLYIQKRDYSVVKLEAPADAICFQLGEVMQIVSGGIFKAMPHAVIMPTSKPDISRAAFAIFMEPNFTIPLDIPKGQKEENVYTREDAKHKLSPLEDRWKPGMLFGEYFENCKQAFHTK